MIVADTGAVLALVDADDHHHSALLRTFQENPLRWVLPWAILPEVDYLIGRSLGPKVRTAFVADLALGAFAVEWGKPADLEKAHRLCKKYRDLDFGLVDAVVMAVAERLRAEAIATLDLRDFGAVELKVPVRLLPRDL